VVTREFVETVAFGLQALVQMYWSANIDVTATVNEMEFKFQVSIQNLLLSILVRNLNIDVTSLT
jgi:hypothetical protein